MYYKSHHDEPPNGDKTILTDKNFKGYIRGRFAEYQSKQIMVIYNVLNNRVKELIRQFISEFKKTEPKISDSCYVVAENIHTKQLEVVGTLSKI